MSWQENIDWFLTPEQEETLLRQWKESVRECREKYWDEIESLVQKITEKDYEQDNSETN